MPLGEDGGLARERHGRDGSCVASRKQRRRPAFRAGGFSCAGSAWASSLFVAFLYSQPLRSYLSTRDELEQRAPEVAVASREESCGSSAASRKADTPAALSARPAGSGYVKPGERLFIVKGIAAWRRAHEQNPPLASGLHGRPRARRAPARPPAARIPARRRPLPVRRAGRHRAVGLRRDGRAVPDDVLRHLPAPRRRDRAARGGRRSRALERDGSRATRRSPRAWPARPPSSAASRRVRRAAESGPTTERRSTSASAARATPSSSSACMPTPPSRSPARATSSASASWRRSSHSGPNLLHERARRAPMIGRPR